MGDALMDTLLWINPWSIWIAAIGLSAFYLVIRSRVANPASRGWTAYGSYVGFGGVLGCVLMAVALSVAMGAPAGPVFVMVVLWPLSFSLGATVGALVWWWDLVKPNNTLEADPHKATRAAQRER